VLNLFIALLSIAFGQKNLHTFVLLNLEASTCFLNEEFNKLHKITLFKKPKRVHVEIINGQLLSLKDVSYRAISLNVLFDSQNNLSVFNIIKIPLNPIILGLFGLKKYNMLKD